MDISSAPFLEVPGDCLMSTKEVYDNGDVRFVIEMNFDIDEWVEQLGKKGVAEIMKRCRKYLLSVISTRFAKGIGPGGVFWAPLKPATIARKGHNKILRHVGALARSIVSSVYGDELIISTNRPYAKWLQTGANYLATVKQSAWMWHNLYGRPKGNPYVRRHVRVAARPFFGFDRQNEKHIERIILSVWKSSERMGK
jgi:phage gpG-like protein